MSDTQLLIQKVQETYLKAESLYNRKFVRPRIRFDLRGTTAGTAKWNSFGGMSELRFNMVLFSLNRQDFLDNTVPHEVAHLLNRELNQPLYRKIMPHGREWQRVMIRLGLNPERCHKYDVSLSRVKIHRKWEYKCACQTHKVGKKVHLKLLAGSTYTCRRCKTKIERKVEVVYPVKEVLVAA